jgi:hypothetical protein
VGARNSEINIPAAQTPPSQVYMHRASSPPKASPVPRALALACAVRLVSLFIILVRLYW